MWRAALAAAAISFPAWPAFANIGRLGGGGELGISLGRILAALLVCLVVAFLAILLIRQKTGKADLAAIFSRLELRSRAIEVVETRRLSPHADVCLVRHAGHEYLLLLQAGNARILREIHSVGEDAQPEVRT